MRSTALRYSLKILPTKIILFKQLLENELPVPGNSIMSGIRSSTLDGVSNKLDYNFNNNWRLKPTCIQVMATFLPSTFTFRMPARFIPKLRLNSLCNGYHNNQRKRIRTYGDQYWWLYLDSYHSCIEASIRCDKRINFIARFLFF